MTNFEKIKNMTVQEFAELILSDIAQNFCNAKCCGNYERCITLTNSTDEAICKNTAVKWLNDEAEEENEEKDK